MKTIKCPNPECEGAEHALFYTLQSKGKKTLNYNCDKVARSGEDKYGYTYACRYITQTQTVTDFVDGLDIPTIWSHAYKKEQEGKSQLQFILMNQ